MGAELPFWPRMMRRDTAARYVSLSVSAFEREIADGRLPLPVMLGGQNQWSRTAIDDALESLSTFTGDGRAQSKLYSNAR